MTEALRHDPGAPRAEISVAIPRIVPSGWAIRASRLRRSVPGGEMVAAAGPMGATSFGSGHALRRGSGKPERSDFGDAQNLGRAGAAALNAHGRREAGHAVFIRAL